MTVRFCIGFQVFNNQTKITTIVCIKDHTNETGRFKMILVFSLTAVKHMFYSTRLVTINHESYTFSNHQLLLLRDPTKTCSSYTQYNYCLVHYMCIFLFCLLSAFKLININIYISCQKYNVKSKVILIRTIRSIQVI